MCAADLLGWPLERVAKEAGIPVLLEASIKVALDLEWSTPDAKPLAINILVKQLDSLDAWLRNKLPEEMARPPLKEHVETLAQIREQDLEPDPSGGGRTRIRHGVAPERRVSVEHPEMRHGRKSKTKLFHGYKRRDRHTAGDRRQREPSELGPSVRGGGGRGVVRVATTTRGSLAAISVARAFTARRPVEQRSIAPLRV